jgi:hypothetical protein
MITIRSSADVSEPTLISLEATLTTPHGRYAISSDGAVADFSSSLADGLFGAISWPQSRLRLAPRVVLDQQIFLPHDNSAVAIAWQLRGEGVMPIHLSVAPFFAACAPAPIGAVDFASNQTKKEGGSPGCRMCSVRKSSRIATAATSTNLRDQPLRLIAGIWWRLAASNSN